MHAIIIPDPKNERGHLLIERASGKVLAKGYLEVEAPAFFTEPSPGIQRSVGVRFVEHLEDD
jgi:hypothetical protein